MNPELARILDLIDSATRIRVSIDDGDDVAHIDVTADFKSLRGLIHKDVADETMRCAAEVEGLPTIRESDKPFKDFAVNVLRGMKIY